MIENYNGVGQGVVWKFLTKKLQRIHRLLCFYYIYTPHMTLQKIEHQWGSNWAIILLHFLHYFSPLYNFFFSFYPSVTLWDQWSSSNISSLNSFCFWLSLWRRNWLFRMSVLIHTDSLLKPLALSTYFMGLILFFFPDPNITSCFDYLYWFMLLNNECSSFHT